MLRVAFFFILLLSVKCFSVNAQQNPSDLSSIKVDALSDAQIIQLLRQAQLSNATTDQVLKAAIASRLPDAELRKLELRINAIRGRNTLADSSALPRRVVEIDSSQNQIETDTLRKKIFGADLFNGRNLTFEPNLRLATPSNYILGPDDQLNISVFGRSVANWRLSVSPDGTINIPAVGVINVSGKSIEQATALIRSRLIANNYAIGNGTSLNITLGNIRSIKVLLVGEIVKPGTYTLPSLATIFNALYASGGPTNNGSFRQIELIRNNRIIRKLDIYDFLLNGSQSDNINLKDQDIIRVPTYQVRVDISGEVKRPAIFEVLKGEYLSDVIRFAGGFKDEAFVENIKAVQIIDQELQLIDITEDNYKNYVPLRGDKYIVARILNRYKNRVIIEGAVFRPGVYALDKGLSLAGLIKSASGLREGAFASRGFIKRLKPDNSTELLPFNTFGIVNGSFPDIILKREDVVTIPSILDIRSEYYITINGQVRNSGDYAYSDSMTVEDLIIMAGGFTEQASSKRISVARRINNARPDIKNGAVAQVAVIDASELLDVNRANFRLKPFDIVNIYTSPGFEKQRSVKIEGEVFYPGNYVIESNNERVSDIIRRAGGLTASANAEGGTLKRKVNLNLETNDSTAFVREEQLKKLQRSVNSNSFGNIDSASSTELVGINIEKILTNANTPTNIILEDGDLISIPKEQNIVHVKGEVLQSSAVVYVKSKTLRQYVSNAGGFSSNALKNKAYVVYLNGAIESSGNFLFFHNSPQVKPGSTIFVPKKPVRRGITTTELVGIGGTLVSVGAILLSVLK